MVVQRIDAVVEIADRALGIATTGEVMPSRRANECAPLARRSMTNHRGDAEIGEQSHRVLELEEIRLVGAEHQEDRAVGGQNRSSGASAVFAEVREGRRASPTSRRVDGGSAATVFHTASVALRIGSSVGPTLAACALSTASNTTATRRKRFGMKVSLRAEELRWPTCRTHRRKLQAGRPDARAPASVWKTANRRGRNASRAGVARAESGAHERARRKSRKSGSRKSPNENGREWVKPLAPGRRLVAPLRCR